MLGPQTQLAPLLSSQVRTDVRSWCWARGEKGTTADPAVQRGGDVMKRKQPLLLKKFEFRWLTWIAFNPVLLVLNFETSRTWNAVSTRTILDYVGQWGYWDVNHLGRFQVLMISSYFIVFFSQRLFHMLFEEVLCFYFIVFFLFYGPVREYYENLGSSILPELKRYCLSCRCFSVSKGQLDDSKGNSSAMQQIKQS